MQIEPKTVPEEAQKSAAAVTGSIEQSDERIYRSGIVEDEFDALIGILNKHQLAVLRELTRLYRSLRGPQDLLEATANFNRPPYPRPIHHGPPYPHTIPAPKSPQRPQQ